MISKAYILRGPRGPKKVEIDIVLEISKCTIVREGLAVIDVTVVPLVVLADLIVLLETLHKFVY